MDPTQGILKIQRALIPLAYEGKHAMSNIQWLDVRNSQDFMQAMC